MMMGGNGQDADHSPGQRAANAQIQTGTPSILDGNLKIRQSQPALELLDRDRLLFCDRALPHAANCLGAWARLSHLAPPPAPGQQLPPSSKATLPFFDNIFLLDHFLPSTYP